jgi:polysaccharide export outer membrane protein
MKRGTQNIFYLFLIALMLAFSGCASSSKRADVPVVESGTVPVAPLADNLAPYRIQIGDELQIRMLLNPELDEDISVQPDGMISTAVVQNMPAYGKTAAELQKSLIQAYKSQLVDPQLTVVVKSFAPSKIYVLGEVETPGEMITVGPNMTLLQALARAGGLRNSADEQNIMIFRKGAGEKTEMYRADYKGATDGVSPAQDVRLAAYDVVFVPRTGVADAYKSYQQNIQQFLPASLGLGMGVR